MNKIRIILLALTVLIAGILVLSTSTGSFGGASNVTYSEDDFSADIALAESNYDLNSDNTDNVYQQQVVAQWGIREMVTVTANQNAAMINNQTSLGVAVNSLERSVNMAGETNAKLNKSILIMMGLLVLAVAIIGGTMNGVRRPKEQNADTSTDPNNVTAIAPTTDA